MLGAAYCDLLTVIKFVTPTWFSLPVSSPPPPPTRRRGPCETGAEVGSGPEAPLWPASPALVGRPAFPAFPNVWLQGFPKKGP